MQGIALWDSEKRLCPKPSQPQRTGHLASIAIDQINLIRTLDTYTETFRSSTPKLSVDSHNRLIPVEFYNE